MVLDIHFHHVGSPKTPVSDNGPHFRSKQFEEWCRLNVCASQLPYFISPAVLRHGAYYVGAGDHTASTNSALCSTTIPTSRQEAPSTFANGNHVYVRNYGGNRREIKIDSGRIRSSL